MRGCKSMKDDKVGFLIRKWGAAENKIREYLTSLEYGMWQECDCEDPCDTVDLQSDDDSRYNTKYCCKCGGWIEWND
jgi:hypothetical protein